MKRSKFFLLCLLASTLSYSQNFTDKEKELIPDGINVTFHPKDLLKTITIASQRLSNQNIISFFFAGNVGDHPVSIRTDSLILRSNSNDLLIIHHPLSDSIIENGSLMTWSVLHMLDSREVQFIKEKKIETLILVVDKHPVPISISKRSQNQLKKLAIDSW